MSPEAMKIVSLVLPAISFLFTFWLPAAVQVSFLTTGIMSYLQMQLFQSKTFRERFGLYPLQPHPNSQPGTGAPSPYKGIINVRARQEPLSQEELNSTYTKPSATETAEFKAGQQALNGSKPPGTLKRIVGGALDDVKGTFKSVKESTAGITDTAREAMERRKKKADKEAAIKFEKKRQEEEKRERRELEYDRRALRAAKKAEKRSR
jgi:YidC/Oxa1 family membrane protein insertase